VRPIFAYQAGKIAGRQHEQHEDAGNIDCEYDVLQAVEIVGVLCRPAQQEQGDENEADRRRGEQQVERAL